MNIYICSTVRHLLFALLRAAHHTTDKHFILFFSDYQGVTLDAWRLDALSKNTKVVEVERASFRRRLNATIGGKIFYFLAMRNLAAPKMLQRALLTVLKEDSPELHSYFKSGKPAHLWLFNERNKMSRVFRLLTQQFSIIEDGQSNYYQFECPWWKRPLRLLLGRPVKFRSYGEDHRCQSIWVQTPDLLPQHIRHKGKKIDFLAGRISRQTITVLFGNEALMPEGGLIAILATQPLDRFAGVEIQDKLNIYLSVMEHLVNTSHTVLLKLHPSEELADYEPLLDKVTVIPGQIPLEAYLASSDAQPLVISLWSAAGLGFEDYCTRIQLSDDDHAAKLMNWISAPEMLTRTLEKKLPA